MPLCTPKATTAFHYFDANDKKMKPEFRFFVAQLILFARGIQETNALRRDRLGCFDDYPMSCDEHKVPLEEIDFDLDQVCFQISEEVLLTGCSGDCDANTVHLHPEFLNGLDAQDEFCSKMQAAYSHCAWCLGPDLYWSCGEESHSDQLICGGKPTRAGIVADNDLYPQFQSEEDIDSTCAKLAGIYESNMNWPRSSDTCGRQHLVKHLCPGECEGGCFDEFVHPPSCQIEGNATVFADGEWDDTCNWIWSTAFHRVGHDGVFNLSTHLDYLKKITDDNPNCAASREAYAHCFWCAGPDTLCFHESRPATCDVPEMVLLGDVNSTQLESFCEQIFDSMPAHFAFDDLLDPESHTSYMYTMGDNDTCAVAREVYTKCPFCDPLFLDLRCLDVDPCDIYDPIPEEYLSNIVDEFSMTGNVAEACQERKDGLREYYDFHYGRLSTDGCLRHIAVTRVCPDLFCSNPEEDALQRDTNYLGTTTEVERKALIWASRCSAFLSFFGASFILYSILTDPKSRTTVYHSLLIGMAIFDIVTAFAWCFATAPINKDDQNALHVEGIMGTEGTCKAQAFFIQLGFTSVFYNTSLAVYYLLVIKYGWKEFQLKKIQLYMHLLPVIVGVGLALGAIPVYHWIEYGCHLEPYPVGELWSVLVFAVLPLGLSILAITAAMLMVYDSVRQRSAASKKWSLGIGKAGKMEKAVFWQCLFYTMVFYISWPIVFSVYLFSVDVDAPLGFTMTVAFVAPLSGFMNFLVFVRPKVINAFQHKSKRGFVSRFVSSMRSSVTSPKFSTQTIEASAVRPNNSVRARSEANENDLQGMDPSAAVALSPRIYIPQKPILSQKSILNFSRKHLISEEKKTALSQQHDANISFSAELCSEQIQQEGDGPLKNNAMILSHGNQPGPLIQ